MSKISTDKIVRLWGHLETQFKVAVQSIGTGLDENSQPCAKVILGPNPEPDTKLLPDSFEGENVRYIKSLGSIKPL